MKLKKYLNKYTIFTVLVCIIFCVLIFEAYDAGIEKDSEYRTKKGPFWAFVLGATVGFVIGVGVNVCRNFIMAKAQKKWINIKDLFGEILFLISYVSSIDGHISYREKNYILKKASRYYKPEQVEQIRLFLEEKNDIDEEKVWQICARMKDNYPFEEKKRIMGLLIGITISDQYLHEKELQIIHQIASRLDFPKLFVQHLYDQYNFTSQAEHKKRIADESIVEESNESKLNQALSVLEIEETPNVEQIKSRYRELAKELHPDKNIDLPEWEQKLLAERLMQVTEAYDYLLVHISD